MLVNNSLTKLLHIKFPVIMAPMFLVSNEEMMKAAIDSGIAGAFPSLNYRRQGELEGVLERLNQYMLSGNPQGSYGVNLIVQKTNPLYEKHLDVCITQRVPFYITSLGNPKEVIEQAHRYGARVFCDVTNLEHAKKCQDAGCDAFIAVGQGAGGHAGPYPLQVLVPALRRHFPQTPVVSAGSIATGAGVLSMLALGADGVSVGTRFIASQEAGVASNYKEAIVQAHMDDIVLTTRISGTPCNIIDTPYARKIGYRQNWLERLLSSNKTTKKYFKMLVQLRGMKWLERSVKPGNYQNLWSAGQSVELIHDIKPCREIVKDLKAEAEEACKKLVLQVEQT